MVIYSFQVLKYVKKDTFLFYTKSDTSLNEVRIIYGVLMSPTCYEKRRSHNILYELLLYVHAFIDNDYYFF